MNDSRLPLLERHARAYAREQLAIVWTAGLDGDDAKRVVTPDWQTTTPLRNSDGGDWAAGYMGKRGQRKNPAVTARTSNLILIDCDTAQGLREIESLGLPKTWTVQSSAPSKRHFYFRPPPEAAQLPKVGFRFEEDGFSADKNRYLVCPPALHPSGAVYRFLHGPFDGTPIGVMPLGVYQERYVARSSS